VDITYKIVLFKLLLLLFWNIILRSPNLIVVVLRNSYPTSQRKTHQLYEEYDQAMLVIGVHKVQEYTLWTKCRVLLKMD
jgi:hypothetical protein